MNKPCGKATTWLAMFAATWGALLPGLPLLPAAERSTSATTDAKTDTAKGDKADAVKDATFDDIKLELKKDDPFDKKALTEKVKKLDGKAVRIRGYILPSFQQSGIKQFVLVRDNMECCFGPGAALFDCIVVEMKGDKTATFSVRPVSVEGVFKVQELKDPDGKTLAIYHLDGKEVK